MDDNIKVLLLKIIKFNGDISPLIQLGYEYAQVTSLIKIEIEEKNAHYLNGTLFLTEKGNSLISKLISSRPPGSNSWIEPEYASKISKIDKDFIFLPNRKELSF